VKKPGRLQQAGVNSLARVHDESFAKPARQTRDRFAVATDVKGDPIAVKEGAAHLRGRIDLHVNA
jgi:hypothetical protein